jgi:xanthine/uracil permease
MQKPWMTWTGRVLSAGIALMLTFSAVMKFRQAPEVVDMFTGQLGYPASILVTIGIIEILCVALYALPPTRVLGAILLTGYLGGAIATHVRIGDDFLPPLVLGVVVWAALFLRDASLRRLLTLVGQRADQ